MTGVYFYTPQAYSLQITLFPELMNPQHEVGNVLACPEYKTDKVILVVNKVGVCAQFSKCNNRKTHERSATTFAALS